MGVGVRGGASGGEEGGWRRRRGTPLVEPPLIPGVGALPHL